MQILNFFIDDYILKTSNVICGLLGSEHKAMVILALLLRGLPETTRFSWGEGGQKSSRKTTFTYINRTTQGGGGVKKIPKIETRGFWMHPD